jgi:hypothetical protein
VVLGIGFGVLESGRKGGERQADLHQINKPPALNKPFLTDNNDGDSKITPN